MTEFELNDGIQAIASNLIAAEALFLTVLSAYVVIAYAVGSKLNTYQIAFMNFVFIGFAFINLSALYSMTDQIYYLGKMSAAFRSEGQMGAVGESVYWLILSIRLLMAFGALVFMWQVRHPKTD
jgi:hypothetical protein